MSSLDYEVYGKIVDMARHNYPEGDLAKMALATVNAYDASRYGFCDLDNPSPELVLYNELWNYVEDGKVHLDFLEIVLQKWLAFTILNFPDGDRIAFITLEGIPEEQRDYVKWFLSVRFILECTEIGKDFKCRHVFDFDYLMKMLVNSNYLMDGVFDLNEYLNKPTPFAELQIKFV